MCGLFGYIGPRNPIHICLTGLKHLEYRGYDSSGLAGINKGALFFKKEVGKLAALENAFESDSTELELAIAHTRWATHGKASVENAHPHFDQRQTIAVVHNGIIENHFSLREMLENKGHTFYSDSDTEVIAQLISSLYEGELLPAVQKALALLQGSWGLAIIHKDHPGQIVAASKENPITIGFNPSTFEAFIASDSNAFSEAGLDVMFLQNDEVALITSQKVDVFDRALSLVHKKTQRFTLDSSVATKNGYAHFMLKEIFEQPQTLYQAFHNRVLPKEGSVVFEDFKLTEEQLRSFERIIILGCGTSWHAGLIAASLIEESAQIPCSTEIASEFRYKNPLITPQTLIIAISQSGETLDTIAAMREAKHKGATTLAICNVPNATISREADALILMRAGPEISVCSTKAFTSQLTTLFLFALHIARTRNTLSQEKGQALIKELFTLPEHVEKILRERDALHMLAKKYAHFEHFFFLGRHYMYATSLEAALKLKEISYLNAQGYPAGEMKHGPIALIDHNVAIVGMGANKLTAPKMVSNLLEAKSRGAPILVFAHEGCEDMAKVASDIFWLPPLSDLLSTITAAVASQLFAYFIALEKGTDIDQPRHLAKSVTVE